MCACWTQSSSNSPEEPSPASALNANKAGAIFTFLGASAAGVWLPYFIPVNPEILKFGVLFSAGLFISLALLELTEEAYEVMEHATGSSKCTLCLAFRILIILDQQSLTFRQCTSCRLPLRFPGRCVRHLLDVAVRHRCEGCVVQARIRGGGKWGEFFTEDEPSTSLFKPLNFSH